MFARFGSTAIPCYPLSARDPPLGTTVRSPLSPPAFGFHHFRHFPHRHHGVRNRKLATKKSSLLDRIPVDPVPPQRFAFKHDEGNIDFSAASCSSHGRMV